MGGVNQGKKNIFIKKLGVKKNKQFLSKYYRLNKLREEGGNDSLFAPSGSVYGLECYCIVAALSDHPNTKHKYMKDVVQHSHPTYKTELLTKCISEVGV